MTPTTLVRCADCSTTAPEVPQGWLRCPNCDVAFCPTCARAHHETATGECDSTAACTACGYTCLVEL